MIIINHGTLIVNNYGAEIAQEISTASPSAPASSPKPLTDTIKGKPQPWRKKKKKTMALSRAYHSLGENKRANRIWWCGSELAFVDNPATGALKLRSANFCRERLCMMCNWRKSIKTYYNVSKVYDAAQLEYPNAQAIFVTLTVRNVDGSGLKDTISNMFIAWDKLLKHRRICTAKFLGWFRALEVTYNRDKNEYHPHFHAIILVDKSYFTDDRAYLDTPRLVQLWRIALGADYDPICDVRAVFTEGDKKYKAVAEVAKYTLKDTDYIFTDEEKTAEVVGTLSNALKGRRLFAFGGVLKKIAKILNKETPDGGDLVRIDEEAVMREEIADALLYYDWDFGIRDYFRRV
jgi:plasmid rolling circle replication initiator protein Rep